MKTLAFLILLATSVFALDLPKRTAEEQTAIENIIEPLNAAIVAANAVEGAEQKPLLTPDSYELSQFQSARQSWVESDIKRKADELQAVLVGLPLAGRIEAIEVLMPVIQKHSQPE